MAQDGMGTVADNVTPGGEVSPHPSPSRVAVIGSGVAGLVAAHVASRSAQVTLFEADTRLGGHADTHRVVEGGRELAIDTGFIVHNERTYPVLLRLFRELGIRTQDSEMSMSVSDETTGLEYAGALGLRGLFPTLRSAASPTHLRMLTEIPRFHRRARRLLAREEDEQTLGDFLGAGRFSTTFHRHFAEPLVAAVWSCDPDVALDYPARYLFRFLEHHGMLGVFGSPQWRTVTGGSGEYVERVAAGIQEVRTGTKVVAVHETPDGVEVTDGNGETRRYDAVVVATHPDQALAMLAEPTRAQREVLAALPYSSNTAHLHTDSTLLPRARNAWASWNFLRTEHAQGRVTVSYDLTRLMRLPTDRRYLVTLGGGDRIDPDTILATREYAHPLYTPGSVAAQARLPEIDTDRVSFAGAYHGWGFHEDGARSGLRAAERLGFRWEGPSRRPLPATPALYDGTITHTRRRPFRRTFTHRSLTWLVDLDDLPDHGVLGRFEARDHLGDPSRSIKDNVVAFLAQHGVDLDDGRVLMAANARALGYCFNPISVHWCFDLDDTLAAVVVEVHNTYGDRHAYLVRPDAQGRASTDKQMYVSPFHGTDGHYELAVPVPGERLEVGVTLHSDRDPSGRAAVFSAALHGRRLRRPTRGAVLRAAPAALTGSALIRAHGIRLWARRLPIRPRPTHHRQEGV
jgi:uncharacterized protein